MIYIPHGRRGSMKNLLSELYAYCQDHSTWSAKICKMSPRVSHIRLNQSRCSTYMRPFTRGEVHLSGNNDVDPAPTPRALAHRWKRLNASSIRPWQPHHMYPRRPSVMVQFEVNETSMWVHHTALFIDWIEHATRDDGLILDACSCVAVPNSASRPVSVSVGVVSIPYSSGYYAEHQKIADLLLYHWEVDLSMHGSIDVVAVDAATTDARA